VDTGTESTLDVSEPRPVIRVVAAAVVRGRQLLLVSKRSAPSVFFLPGGKPEAGESWWTCLKRELREELAVDIRDAEPLTDVRAAAALEAADLHMSVYLTRVLGRPTPAAEIHSTAWWPSSRALTLAPAIAGGVIPELRQRGLL
jgi:8-oxo-dGTP diphosphatase